MTAFRQVVVCCDVRDCRMCTTTVAIKSVKAARNALYLGGWTRRKKQDRCPMHNPKRNDYQRRRTGLR